MTEEKSRRYLQKRAVVLVLVAILLAMAAVGCGSQSDENQAESPADDYDRGGDGGTPDLGAPGADNGSGSVLDPSAPPGEFGSKIIYHGEANLYVMNFDESAQKLEEKVHQLDGYIADSSTYEYQEGEPYGSWTMRVPAEHFNTLMNYLHELGRVEGDRTFTDNVTQQYIDLESRIRTLEGTETRLLEILDMAENVTEVLEVERELNRVRQEKESLQTQFNYLKQQVSYSTVSVHMEEEAGQQQVTGGGISSLGTRISRAFKGSVDFVLAFLGSLLVVLIGGLPVIILIAIPVCAVILIYRFVKKRRSGS